MKTLALIKVSAMPTNCALRALGWSHPSIPPKPPLSPPVKSKILGGAVITRRKADFITAGDFIAKRFHPFA